MYIWTMSNSIYWLIMKLLGIEIYFGLKWKSRLIAIDKTIIYWPIGNQKYQNYIRSYNITQAKYFNGVFIYSSSNI